MRWRRDAAPGSRGVALTAGDGIAIEDVATLTICARSEAEFLLFDLA